MMKPVWAIASMALGTTTVASVAYMASTPDALVSHTPRYHRYVEVPVQARGSSRTEAEDAPSEVQFEPILIKSAPAKRLKRAPASRTSASPSRPEPTLMACSDWRPLGPSSVESGTGSGEHRVRLLCPMGASAEDTFLAEAQLHPMKLQLNDWSQTGQD